MPPWLLDASGWMNRLLSQTIGYARADTGTGTGTGTDTSSPRVKQQRMHPTAVLSCAGTHGPVFGTHSHQQGFWIAHGIDDGDSLEGLSPGKTMIAGATAGVMEHICMFPVDTIKTRMQALSVPGHPTYRSVFHAAADIARREGPTRLYRGVLAIVLGAIPSHAVYFATYEFFKEKFGGNRQGYHPVAQGVAGAIATMAHDAVVTPLDVVKQRLQLYQSSYLGVRHAVSTIIKQDGWRAFYASYPTTVLMNVPFMAVHFATYESLKHMLSDEHGHHHTKQHLLAGAGAGALGGLVSNPLDVVKTRIQTMGVNGAPRYLSSMDAAASIFRAEGIRAFTQGTQARILYFMPSAAICWTTYEAMKSLLDVHSHHDDHDHDHHH